MESAFSNPQLQGDLSDDDLRLIVVFLGNIPSAVCQGVPEMKQPWIRWNAKGFDAGWNVVPTLGDDFELRDKEDKVQQQPNSPNDQVNASGILADGHLQANSPLNRTFTGTVSSDLLRRARFFEAEELLSGFNSS